MAAASFLDKCSPRGPGRPSSDLGFLNSQALLAQLPALASLPSPPCSPIPRPLRGDSPACTSKRCSPDPSSPRATLTPKVLQWHPWARGRACTVSESGFETIWMRNSGSWVPRARSTRRRRCVYLAPRAPDSMGRHRATGGPEQRPLKPGQRPLLPTLETKYTNKTFSRWNSILFRQYIFINVYMYVYIIHMCIICTYITISVYNPDTASHVTQTIQQGVTKWSDICRPKGQERHFGWDRD